MDVHVRIPARGVAVHLLAIGFQLKLRHRARRRFPLLAFARRHETGPSFAQQQIRLKRRHVAETVDVRVVAGHPLAAGAPDVEVAAAMVLEHALHPAHRLRDQRRVAAQRAVRMTRRPRHDVAPPAESGELPEILDALVARLAFWKTLFHVAAAFGFVEHRFQVRIGLGLQDRRQSSHVTP